MNEVPALQESGHLDTTPEEWRPIPGYPFYEASSQGRIRSLDMPVRRRNFKGEWMDQFSKGKVLSPHPCRARVGKVYLKVMVRPRKNVFVHRLVALAFRGLPPEGKGVVCHLNDEGKDNRAENIAWDSHSANCHMRGKVGQQDLRPEDVPAADRGDAWEATA